MSNIYYNIIIVTIYILEKNGIRIVNTEIKYNISTCLNLFHHCSNKCYTNSNNLIAPHDVVIMKIEQDERPPRLLAARF